MGCCPSAASTETTNVASNSNQATSQNDVKKLLFLGPGGCGKSTLFKQLRQSFGDNIEEDERMLFGEHIFSFIIETVIGVTALIENKTQLSKEGQEAAAFMDRLEIRTVVNDTIAAQIKILWHEPAFKKIFEEEAKLKLVHSCAHFLDDIDRIGAKGYIPTDLDILLQRRPTTGLIEQNLRVNQTSFQIFDVGGQKNERRKWIHLFENVSAVIFVASLSSFDEPMFDDETTNSLDDSIQLFEEICDLPYFVHQHMVLVLNKKDLLQEKLSAGKKLRDFPVTKDYTGADDDLEAVIKFIESKFQSTFERSLSRLRKSTARSTSTAAERRLLFIRVTCAYKSESVETVFSDVQGILTGRITSNETEKV